MFKNSLETKQNCIINFADARPIATAWVTYDVCVRKDFVLEPGKTYTLANSRANPGISILEHLSNNKHNIKLIETTSMTPIDDISIHIDNIGPWRKTLGHPTANDHQLIAKQIIEQYKL